MVIIMEPQATDEQIKQVMLEVEAIDCKPFINPGVERKVIAVLGEIDARKAELVEHFETLPGVERVTLISEPYKLASRSYHTENTIIKVENVQFGGNGIVIIAGPCSVESEQQLLTIAQVVKEAGAHMLRGGAFKPRTSPYSFQGMGKKGLALLAKAKKETGLPVVTEVMDPHDIHMVCEYADMLQIGTRNMQNFPLLKKVGQSKQPVLLKRGMGSKIKDLLMAAEYIMSEGNHEVVLCERGITTFEDASRNTTDINAVPILHQFTHLPIVLDPSHSTGNWQWVGPVAKAAIAAGADGLMVEVHHDPVHAKSDGSQSLKPDKFGRLMEELRLIAQAVGRTL